MNTDPRFPSSWRTRVRALVLAAGCWALSGDQAHAKKALAEFDTYHPGAPGPCLILAGAK
ncbi:MAG: hypothetical protein FJ387_04850 [Verrucomicrobia bacterium]|nr:hypothetical protein [Verrucomicrobiota bacterium]